ncbi:ABC transporter permease [Staphylococcus simiae]|nr:ABC transporter permease [Staphylococcus simiae]
MNNMKVQLLSKIIRSYFKSQRHIVIPFVMATSCLFMIEYILLSVIFNDYIQRINYLLVVFIVISNIFLAFLALVFITYANHFVMTYRKQEFSVYMMLGMRRRDLHSIVIIEMFIQFCIITLISIMGGYLFGALFFLIFQKLMGERDVSLAAYPFNTTAMMITVIIIAITMVIVLVFNLIKIRFQSPMVQQQDTGQQTLSRWLSYILITIGSLLLVISYWIALQDHTTFDSFMKLWFLLLCVIVGTYTLFIGLSDRIIHIFQKITSLFYHPKYFIVLIGLRQRLKVNAVSLATIALLCTFLIVTLTMTMTTYRDIDNGMNKLLTNDYDVKLDSKQQSHTHSQHTAYLLLKDIKKHVNVEQPKIYQSSLFRSNFKFDNQLMIMQPKHNTYPANYIKFDDVIFGNKTVMVTVLTMQDYNKYHQPIDLKNNELGMITYIPVFKSKTEVSLNHRKYSIKPVTNNNLNIVLFQDSMALIVKNDKQRHQILKYFNQADNDISTTINFNTANHEPIFQATINRLEDKYKISITSKNEITMLWNNLSSGLIFMGGLVSIVLMIGIFLMIYYKQVSEGYEDQKKYQIMQQVGLARDKIKPMIHSQIRWFFSIPMIMAVCHSVFALKIIHTVLIMIGISNINHLITSYIIVIITVSLLYSLIYWLTSRIYVAMLKQHK